MGHQFADRTSIPNSARSSSKQYFASCTASASSAADVEFLQCVSRAHDDFLATLYRLRFVSVTHHRAAVAATARGAKPEVMNDIARAQAGAMLRARLAARIANGDSH